MIQDIKNIYDFKLYNLFPEVHNKYNYITHVLFPNNTSIFQSYIDKNYVIKFSYNFLILVYPVYKLYWKNMFICYNQNINKIYLDNKEIYSTSIELINDFLIDGIEIKNNIILIKSNKSTISYSAYAYATILNNLPMRLGDLNINQILGIVESANTLGILSNNKEYKTKFPINIDNINLENNILFNYNESNLRSTQPDIQLKIFDLFMNRLNSIVSGGTGIGKTSIVPKIIWWFNLLFDGYNMFSSKINNIDVVNFIFDITLIEKNILLSLPRKTIINSTANNYIKSLGYDEIKKSPVIIKYKDIKLFKQYYNNKIIFPTNLLLCVNRLSINNLKNCSVIIIDEIHEHDRYSDICIAISYFLKNKNNIRNIILISATIEFEIDNIMRFFKNKIVQIYIPGFTLFDVTEIENTTDSVDKILLDYSPIIGHSVIIFCESIPKINNIKRYLEEKIKNPIYKFYAIHGKVPNVNDIIYNIEKNKKYIHVIISTNYLESSITISNAKLIIDNGKEYRKEFIDGNIVYITDSMYKQRRGRVGRVSKGTYIRTYTLDKLNTNFKNINYQYLWDYIIIFKYYGLDLKKDYFVIPDNLNRIDKTINYMKTIGIDIDNNINKIYRIFNRYEINMLEYLIIYLYGSYSEILLLSTYDKSSIDIPYKLYNIYIKMNVRVKLDSKKNITYIFAFIENVYDGPQKFKYITNDNNISFIKNKIYYLKSENPLVII
ncbi:RNA helicase, DExH-NPH-II domain [Choristoneura biennis entomopoxvirus]|uniref:RNA helicase NPH-II n=1 Tax=Choristoneura biennis entomopoxvirus TaxID=10288 RepID=A0A916KPJ5_CBEPV|nr:RNA helicase, DExH-NPH-II domain [Choristoneura biennis entomopoxvirus]CCU55706.1 RNA helicase, DExH-NPH-II domain [Choristoneura biennis entomopoxvirus]